MRHVLYRRYFNACSKIFNIKFIYQFYSNKSIIRCTDIKKFGVLGSIMQIKFDFYHVPKKPLSSLQNMIFEVILHKYNFYCNIHFLYLFAEYIVMAYQQIWCFG